MVLYISLGVFAVLAGAMVYRYDLYDREPLTLLFAAAVAGFGLMALMGPLEGATIDFLGGDIPSDPFIAMVAATHEELGRLILVALIAVALPRHFNDPMDGLIYGSIVSVGMAVEESTFFLGIWNTSGWLLPPTEPVRFCGHLVMGGITGYALGLARFRMPRWGWVLVGCLAFSMGLHFAWDWLAFTAQRAGAMTTAQTALAVGLMGGGMVVYGCLVVRGNEHSRRVFSPNKRRSVWGWPFV